MTKPAASQKSFFFWAKPKNPDGVMSLTEHLKEFRYRVILSTVAICIATIVALIFSDALYQFLLNPWHRSLELLARSRPDIHARAIITGVTTPFTLLLKICAFAGIVLSAPVWLYQIWAFIAPALLTKEKRWALIFLSATTPLFFAGVALAYYILPQGISVLIGFTPNNYGIDNLLDLNTFLNFLIQLMLIFGFAFMLPVIVVIANQAGILPARVLASSRKFVILGIFIFAAVATPSQDPFSMCALAIPMTLLMLGSELICYLTDRRRARRKLLNEE